jgi:2,5-dioxopentanoate dehydrogenase
MKITGAMLIGQADVFGAEGTMRAFDPAKGEEVEAAFGGGSHADVNRACILAEAAFNAYRETNQPTRAAFLRAISQGILELGDMLIERARAETGLPKARLEGERGRTVGQLEMFASIVENGR